jgi:hypothetical protein
MNIKLYGRKNDPKVKGQGIGNYILKQNRTQQHYVLASADQELFILTKNDILFY